MTRVHPIICACGRAAERPADGDHRQLWEAGWRWRGAPEPASRAGFVPRSFVFSCPGCPPVI